MSDKFDKRCPACGSYSITKMLEKGYSHRCTKCDYGWRKVVNHTGIAIFA